MLTTFNLDIHMVGEKFFIMFVESVTIRPQTIRLLQIRPKRIRLHAHSTTYKFVPSSEISPI